MTPERRQSIWKLAGLRARTVPPPPLFDNQFVRDMVAMRKAGIFARVWIDADRIYVQMFSGPDGVKQPMTRFQAEQLIAAWRSPKKKS